MCGILRGHGVFPSRPCLSERGPWLETVAAKANRAGRVNSMGSGLCRGVGVACILFAVSLRPASLTPCYWIRKERGYATCLRANCAWRTDELLGRGVLAACDQHFCPSIPNQLSPFPDRPWASRGPRTERLKRGEASGYVEQGQPVSRAPGNRHAGTAATLKAAPDRFCPATLSFALLDLRTPRRSNRRPEAAQSLGRRSE